MGRFNINNFFSNSVSRNAREAVKEWSLKGYDETEHTHYCELCGTRIKRYYMITNQTSGATLLIGIFCYRSMLNYFEKNELKTSLQKEKEYSEKAKGDLNKFLFDEYRNIVQPGHWIKWTIEQLNEATPDVQRAIRVLRNIGYVDDKNDRKILIKYHDEKRKYSRETLLPGWQRKNIFPPEFLTINESKKYLKQSKTESKPIHKKKLDLSEEEIQTNHERSVKKIEDFKAELEKNQPKLLFTVKGFNQAKETIRKSRLYFNGLRFSFGQAKELIKHCGYEEIVQQYNKVLKNIDRILPNEIQDEKTTKKYLIQKANKEIEGLLKNYLSKLFAEHDQKDLETKLRKLKI